MFFIYKAVKLSFVMWLGGSFKIWKNICILNDIENLNHLSFKWLDHPKPENVRYSSPHYTYLTSLVCRSKTSVWLPHSIWCPQYLFPYYFLLLLAYCDLNTWLDVPLIRSCPLNTGPINAQYLDVLGILILTTMNLWVKHFLE